jgi:3-oxoacyl-[acyl-carrier protein] reductase
MPALDNRIVLITGAGRGIGAATARRLARDGAKVVLADIDKANVEKLAAELGGAAVQADVTRADDITRMVDETYRRFGRLDGWKSPRRSGTACWPSTSRPCSSSCRPWPGG